MKSMSRPAVLLCVAILLLFSTKSLFHFTHYLDIPFFDETEYLYRGMVFPGKVYNDWSPLYNLWYAAIDVFINSPVTLFYTNFALLTMLYPLVLFIFLAQYGIPRNISLLFSLLLVSQPLLVSNMTLVGHFCAILIMMTFIAIRNTKEFENQLAIALTCAILCIYIRLEFLMVLASLLLAGVIFILQKRRFKFSGLMFLPVGTFMVLYFIYGLPGFEWKGIDRSYGAFIQYFYVNYLAWTKKAINIDEFIALDLFKGSKTMLQCLLANPGLFFKHILTNMATYSVSMFKYVEDFMLPKPIFHYLGKGKHVLFLVLLISLLYPLIIKRSYRYWLEKSRQYPYESLLTLAFFLWSFFSIFIVFPNQHYVVMQFFWILIPLGLAIRPYENRLNNNYVFAGVLILLFLFTPSAKNTSYYHSGTADRDKQPNTLAIKYLLRQEPKQPVTLLTAESGFYAYLPGKYTELFPMKEDTEPYGDGIYLDFEKFVAGRNVNVIYLSERMQDLLRRTAKSGIHPLIENPASYGFEKVILSPELKTYLLIKTGTF